MNAETKQQIADWLQFFRDLGYEDLYRRPLAAAAVPEETTQTQERRDHPSHSAPAAPRTQTMSKPASDLRPLKSPGVPPQPPSLFDPPAPAVSKDETLDEIRADLGDCQRCKLAKTRHSIVFGQGNPKAELVFIGEGPGADEDEQGLPFVGRAGQLLNKMLQLVQIKREDVYICNIVKCRPPGNRTPESDEITACSPFLFRQLDSIRPRLICCLGAPAARTVLGIKEGITKVHGQFVEYRNAKAMATVHPAYVLRNPREEVILRQDFTKIRQFLDAPLRNGISPADV